MTSLGEPNDKNGFNGRYKRRRDTTHVFSAPLHRRPSASSMSTLQLALVPLVGRGGGDSTSGILNNRKSSPSSCADNNSNKKSRSGTKRPRRYRPYISLRNEQMDESRIPRHGRCQTAVEFGRTEILTCLYAACGCLDAADSSDTSGPESHNKNEKQTKQTNETKEPKRPTSGTKLPICAHCREAESWCLRYLSRKLIRLMLVHENPPSSSDYAAAGTIIDPSSCTRSDNCTYRVQKRGENAPHCVSIDGIQCAAVQGNNNNNGPMMQQQQQHEKDDEGWTTQPRVVTMGSVISFHHPGENNNKGNRQDERSGKSLHFQLCLVRDTTETGSPSNGCVEVVRTGGTCCSPVGAGAGSSQSSASSCDCGSNDNSKPLTQRSMSEPKIGQNGSCSESQHYHVPPVINGKESQISALDDPPSAPAGERNDIEAGSSGVAVAAHPSESTVEVPSSIPQDPGPTSPALLPPRRSLRRHSPRRQTSASQTSNPAPAGRSSESTAEISSSCPPSHPMQRSEGQEYQALNDDTNTPRPATQRSIIDLMTPESSSSAVTGVNSISGSRTEEHGAQEKLKKLEQPTGHSSSSSGNHKMHPSPIDLTTSPALKSPGQCVIYFLQLGRGMSQARIQLLSKTILAKNPDACIVNSFDSSPAPSHVVIDPQIDAVSVASALQFDNAPEKMASYFAASKIHAVTPQWMLTCDNLHGEPPIDYLWGGYRRYQSASAAKPKVRNDRAVCAVP